LEAPVDFVLVWDTKSEIADNKNKAKRDTFEHNLEQEGIIVTREAHCETGLQFSKLTVPLEVLKRYAEILKLRLPMKKVNMMMNYSIIIIIMLYFLF
jgi:anoctamin-1